MLKSDIENVLISNITFSINLLTLFLTKLWIIEEDYRPKLLCLYENSQLVD